jgi:hypothetical protein
MLMHILPSAPLGPRNNVEIWKKDVREIDYMRDFHAGTVPRQLSPPRLIIANGIWQTCSGDTIVVVRIFPFQPF